MKLPRGKKIFMTGGLGFIGSNVVRQLLKEGEEVLLYDNFSSGNLSKLRRLGISPKDPGLKILKGDILNRKRLTRAMKGCACVIHNAAQLEITRALSDPSFDLKCNTLGTLNVLHAMLANGISLLLNASSACVYGQKKNSELPSKESDPCNPNWAYGVSKLAAEKYCDLFSKNGGLKIISARYAIIYGDNEWYGRVMTLFIKNLLQGKPLVLFGSGRQSRDFTHVLDAVDFTLKALRYLLKREGGNGGFHHVFNVSTGRKTTIRKLSQMLLKESSRLGLRNGKILIDKGVKEGKQSSFINRVRIPNELENMVLDNRKVRKMLGWRPKLTLQEGLKRQILWVGDNLDLWKKMSY